MTALADILLRLNRPYLYFVEMDWAGNMERYHSGFGLFEWQHPDDDTVRTWYGTGNIGRFKLPESGQEIQVDELVFEIFGLDPQMTDENGLTIQQRLDQDIRGGSVKVWIAFLKPDYTVEVCRILQTGVLDRAEWSVTDETDLIRVFARGDFAFFENQIDRKWSAETQRDKLTALGIDPDSDTGFDLIPKQQDNTIAWVPD